METISAKISSHFQIEFVFNIVSDENNHNVGQFHVVQLTQLPEIKFEKIEIPEQKEINFLSINNLQGHGIKTGIKYAVVISPFIYTKEQHDPVRKKLSEINRDMKNQNEDYIILAPGRLGSNNRDWGIQVEYRDVDKAVGLFEYGVDIAGRSEPLPESEESTGGIYGSHFLQTRMYGTQGTHFLTNLVSNNIIYGFIAPTVDQIDPWFFAGSDNDEAIYVLNFPRPVTIYADSINQRCLISS
jgi:hypothetical protein